MFLSLGLNLIAAAALALRRFADPNPMMVTVSELSPFVNVITSPTLAAACVAVSTSTAVAPDATLEGRLKATTGSGAFSHVAPQCPLLQVQPQLPVVPLTWPLLPHVVSSLVHASGVSHQVPPYPLAHVQPQCPGLPLAWPLFWHAMAALHGRVLAAGATEAGPPLFVGPRVAAPPTTVVAGAAWGAGVGTAAGGAGTHTHGFFALAVAPTAQLRLSWAMATVTAETPSCQMPSGVARAAPALGTLKFAWVDKVAGCVVVAFAARVTARVSLPGAAGLVVVPSLVMVTPGRGPCWAVLHEHTSPRAQSASTVHGTSTLSARIAAARTTHTNHTCVRPGGAEWRCMVPGAIARRVTLQLGGASVRACFAAGATGLEVELAQEVESCRVHRWVHHGCARRQTQTGSTPRSDSISLERKQTLPSLELAAPSCPACVALRTHALPAPGRGSATPGTRDGVHYKPIVQVGQAPGTVQGAGPHTTLLLHYY